MRGIKPCVYIAKGDDGAVLYVGRTLDPPRRLTQHRNRGDWWPLVSTIDIEWCETEAGAVWLEQRLILRHSAEARSEGRTTYNIANNPESRKWRTQWLER